MDKVLENDENQEKIHDEQDERMEEDEEEIIPDQSQSEVQFDPEPESMIVESDPVIDHVTVEDDPDDPEIDIELLGQHLERHININQDEINQVIHQNPMPDISIIEETKPEVDQKSPEKAAKASKPSWIDEGIERHVAAMKEAPSKKILKRIKENENEQVQSDHGLAQYINELHKIGFDEDEIEAILKEGSLFIYFNQGF